MKYLHQQVHDHDAPILSVFPFLSVIFVNYEEMMTIWKQKRFIKHKT